MSLPIPLNPRASRPDTSLGSTEWVEEVEPEEGVQAPHVLPLSIRVGIVLALISLMLLTRFGINTGSYGLNVGVPVIYGMIFLGLAKDQFHLDLPALMLYAAFIGVGAVSLLVNMNVPMVADGSLASLVLLASLYVPFVFVLKPFAHSREAWLWGVKAFLNLSLLVCAFGIVQFYLQFVFHPPWLFNFSPMIPKAISADVLANSEIRAGSVFKANGFFLREPSAFSFLMAFSIITEMALFKRWTRLAAFGFGLLLSYSGTGLLALGFGLLWPFGFKTAVRVAIIAAVAGILLLLFGDALNLEFTLGRVGEFNAERSSGYIRYVAPMRLVSELVDSEPWAAFVGHGPGTIFHAVRSYEFHDPTWAKLMFEYGILGFTACMGLMLYSMSRSHAPVQVRATLLFCYLFQGGHLLTPENVLLIYILLSLWPRPDAHRKSFAGSTMPMTTMQFDESNDTRGVA